ncbi:MAG: hypothetical protein WCL48_12325 [Betaproteobacteria bacterium]
MDHTLCLNGRQKKIQRLGAWSLGRAMFIAQGALQLPESPCSSQALGSLAC